MKRFISALTLTLTAAATLSACQQAPQAGPFPAMNPMLQQRAPVMAANSATQATEHHPDFVRKMNNPAQYAFQPDSRRSICGTENNLQHVNDYNGNEAPLDFVRGRQRAVGALARGNDASSRKFCSGTMITEDLFLTASHCIDASVTNDKFVAFNYEKAPGATQLLEQEHFKVVEVVEDGINRLDYAILRLDGKPGLKYGFSPIRAVLPEVQHQLTIIQHPKGQPKQVESGPLVSVSSGAYMAYADLDTEPGSSGSGVLDSQGFLVGVHTNGGCYSGGGANRGVKMTEIIKGSRVVQELNQARR